MDKYPCEINIAGNIDESTASKVIDSIAATDENYHDCINLRICSSGGNLDYAFAIIEAINSSPVPVNTIASGTVGSAALLIFLAGRNRHASALSRFIYHECKIEIEGNLSKTDLDCLYRDIEFYQKKSNDYIVAKTKITHGELTNILSQKIEWSIPADLALNLGIADLMLHV